MYEGTSVCRTVTLHEVIGWQNESKSTKTINNDSMNNRINLVSRHTHVINTCEKDHYHNNVRTHSIVLRTSSILKNITPK